MRIHFIAIGGAVMHNLAIALKRQGNTVTGSDDRIVDPARSNLQREGILPDHLGFRAENITEDLDAVILGMHARKDNPELLKAQELGLQVYSFPEYIYKVAQKKQRVVIAGSHGKTTITSMVMHALRENGYNFDYLVGAKVKGFDTGVRLTEDAPLIVIEGDEYLASPIHPESKFMFYKPHVALISGVAWDHINVFPNYNDYVAQFRKFADSVQEWGFLTWFSQDEELKKIFSAYDAKVRTRPYDTHPHHVKNSRTLLITDFGEIPILVFGAHNLQNIAGAKNICNELGVSDEDFYRAIATFEGAANRLQKLAESDRTIVYKDFAHSPSKLKATVAAVKSQYPQKEVVAIMELHTFSSLNRDFLEQYRSAMDAADVPVVFFDQETFAQKRMDVLQETFVRKAFGNEAIRVFSDRESLKSFLEDETWNNRVLLLMSSGNFSGLDIDNLLSKIL